MFIAQGLPHDITPPVDYSLVPTWLIFVLSIVALTIIGLTLWYAFRFFKRKTSPPKTARQRALEALDAASNAVERTPPYQFSIRVSDILRQFVMEEFGLPMTRQTSVEFLNAIADAPNFTENDKRLLQDFLDRCDLIKFARYQATSEDSRLLLAEARQFVKGEMLVTA